MTWYCNWGNDVTEWVSDGQSELYRSFFKVETLEILEKKLKLKTIIMKYIVFYYERSPLSRDDKFMVSNNRSFSKVFRIGDPLQLSLSVCHYVCQFVCLYTYLSDYLSICLFVYLYIWSLVCLSVCLSVFLSFYLSVRVCVCLSEYFD